MNTYVTLQDRIDHTTKLSFEPLRSMVRGCLFAGVIVLSGCGGGGGGSSVAGSGPGSVDSAVTTPAPSGVDVAVDKSELRFVGVNGSALNEQPLVFSVSGTNVSGTYYASAEPDANAGFDTNITDTSLTSLKMSLRARSTQPSVDGTIKLKLCKDAACASVVWSRSLPYHIRNYKVDVSDIKLSGYEGGTTNITRTITPTPAAGDLTMTPNVGPPGQWLSAQLGSDGVLTMTVNGAGLHSSFSYDGWVQFQRPDHTNAAVIQVVVRIGTGFALPPDSSVDITSASPALVEGSIALAFNGNQAPAWSASSDKPWLLLRSTTGNGAMALGYSIDMSKLASLANFASDTATVTFKAAGLSDSVFRLVVTKKFPEIVSVVPNPVKAGQSATLHLRGRGFQQMGTVGAITANGAPLGSGSIVSDTEAIVNIGPMSEGIYKLNIPIASGVAPAQPVLNVVSTAPLAASLIDGTFYKGALAYSAQRKALYTVDGDNGKLMRYRLIGGSWITDKAIPILRNARVGLSHDGKTLYTVSAPHVLEERDPDTLEVTASYTDTTGYGGLLLNGRIGDELPITSDGRIWFSDGLVVIYFDMLTKTFRWPPITSPISPGFGVSEDGTRMFVTSLNSDDLSLRYDTVASSFDHAPNEPNFRNVASLLSGNGNYVLIGGTDLYESSTYRLIGTLPAGINMYARQGVVSPDGSRIYAAIGMESGDEYSLVRLDVIATDTMTKIGEIPLPSNVNCVLTRWNSCPIGIFKMSPFGDTIFWAGYNKIAVIPIPQSLTQPVGVSFRMVR